MLLHPSSGMNWTKLYPDALLWIHWKHRQLTACTTTERSSRIGRQIRRTFKTKASMKIWSYCGWSKPYLVHNSHKDWGYAVTENRRNWNKHVFLSLKLSVKHSNWRTWRYRRLLYCASSNCLLEFHRILFRSRPDMRITRHSVWYKKNYKSWAMNANVTSNDCPLKEGRARAKCGSWYRIW